MDAETVVQNQLDAYSSRDIELFLTYYSDDIQTFGFGEAKPSIVGKQALKERYKKLFENSPSMKIEIVKRIVFDNKVIDYEKVYGLNGTDLVEAIAISEVKDGLINRVTFIKK